jgi:hypothetical protein
MVEDFDQLSEVDEQEDGHGQAQAESQLEEKPPAALLKQGSFLGI